MIEGELAFKVKKGPGPDEDVAEATGSIFCVIELHNYIFAGEPTAGTLLESNALHAGLVLSVDVSSLLNPAIENMQVLVEGEIVATVAEPDVSNTVLASLGWWLAGRMVCL